MTNLELHMERLIDREAIRDCLFRYCRGIDRCDRALLQSAYWPDGTEHHQSVSGNAYDFIEWCLPLTARAVRTMHSIANTLIELKRPKAKVESQFHANECMRRKDGSSFEMFVGGRYLDTLERRGEEWRILERTLVIDWFRNMGEPNDVDKGVYGHGPERMGRHDMSDISYSHFGG